MRVLLTEFDLFSAVGGGQTFYRGLVARHPQVEFYYFRRNEAADAVRPGNARPIDYQPAYDVADFHDYAEPGPSAWMTGAYCLANNLARSVSGYSFDVVDTADYHQFGLFIRWAMARHGVTCDRVVMSMHGVISTTIAMNWGGNGKLSLPLRRAEVLQYAAADARYFISRMYQDEWHALSPEPSHYLDPLGFFAPPARSTYRPSGGPPALHFLGRTERRKGPHHFVQLLQWLPRESYAAAYITGPDSADPHGNPSSAILQRMIDLRRLDAQLVPCATAAEMGRTFAGTNVVFTPSLYDTLNLTALEALFAGCPTVIGAGCGACRYLDEEHPDLPYFKLDGGRLFADAVRLREYLADYEAHRAALAAALDRLTLAPTGPGLLDVYHARPSGDPVARREVEGWDRQLADACPLKPVFNTARLRSAA